MATIGFGVTGSHCTINSVLQVITDVVELGHEVIPIITPAVDNTDTRFGQSVQWKEAFKTICRKEIISSIVDVEPLGPQKSMDLLVIAPCTGNTMAKLARGITDTAVLMAAKIQFRNLCPVVLSISTNDGLGANAISLGILLNMKNVYMVPFAQDDPEKKSNSLVAKTGLIIPTIELALQGKQIQPILAID